MTARGRGRVIGAPALLVVPTLAQRLRAPAVALVLLGFHDRIYQFEGRAMRQISRCLPIGAM